MGSGPVGGLRSATPTTEPAPKKTATAAEPQKTQPETGSMAAPESMLKTLSVLAVAPVIGLAYVMLLPIIGFGVLFTVIGTGMARRIGWMKS